jgi:predicted AAA+ superfamily ATPase
MLPLVAPADVVGVLRGFNPWWTGRPVQVPVFRRLAFEAARSLLRNEALRRAVLLSGARRVGKTTILQQVAAALLAEGREARSILYLSLDHPLLRLASLRQTLDLYHAHVHPVGRPTVLLLDEVQYLRDWQTEVKLLVDHRPEYRVVATGSASAVLRHLFAYHYRDTPEIGYWRERVGRREREVDMVVRSPAYTIPVEVKYRENAALGADDGIVEYARREGARQAYWVTKRDVDFGVARFPGVETRFLQVPAHVLTYLLGQAERLLWKD